MEKKKLIISIGVILVLLSILLLFTRNQTATPTEVITEPITEEVGETEVESEAPEIEIVDNTAQAFSAKLKEGQDLFVRGEYARAVAAYNQALALRESEGAYTGIFYAEFAAGRYDQAEAALLKAIALNTGNPDYRNWYLTFLADTRNASAATLKNVYEEGLATVLSARKPTLMSHYARILEKRGDRQGAIAIWQELITVNSGNKEVYEAEITRLSQ